MLIDHIGYQFFPQYLIPRAIGRLSMPLFAYSIARGYYYSEKKGEIKKYICNILAFSIISQLPYHYFVEGMLNIGTTWLLSITVIYLSEKKETFLASCVGIGALIIPVDYGLYGVLFPLCFYLFIFRTRKPLYAFIGITVLFAVYVALNGSGGLIQIFTIIAFPAYLFIERYDKKVHIDKNFYYIFYPAHITILIMIKTFF